MMKKVKVGIIGLGAQGSLYTQFILDNRVKNMEIHAICDIDSAKKKEYTEKYPEIPFYENYIDMLDSGLIDSVVVCTPHYSHPEIGIHALERNIHTLIEKPAGVYSKQVKELNEVATSKSELTYGIMFNQRTNALYQKIKEVIDQGEIGAIRRSNWIITSWWRPQAYYDGSEWRATWKGEGGGVLVNQAPHQLDLFQWICGMPKKVYSNVKYGYQREITVEDELTTLFDYGNGATGVFITCTHDLMGTDRLEILGDKGKIVVDDSKQVTIKRLHKSESEIDASMGSEDVQAVVQGKDLSEFYTEEKLEFESVWGAQHIGVLENFAENILYDVPLLAPGSDGINGVELANAIHLSSWLGKEVELPVDEDLFLEELSKRIQEEQK